jgi:branched-chain amino acid aminotransferase
MTLLVNIDGKICQPDEAVVPVLDRGFLYGDSVYEVVRTYEGKPFALKEHLDRFERSAARLDIKLPERAWLEEQVHQTIEAAGNQESYCRIIVTRGGGPITLDPTKATGSLTVILAKEYEHFPDWMYEKGIKVHIPVIRRTPPSAVDPAIKSGNYLNSILALGEARRAGFDDALMLDVLGRVTEATSANVFMYHQRKLYTPSLQIGILEGVTRRLVIDLAAKHGFEVEECDIFPEQLWTAHEVMLTSTLKEVMPVVQVGDAKVSVGKPGAVAKKLREVIQTHAREQVNA